MQYLDNVKLSDVDVVLFDYDAHPKIQKTEKIDLLHFPFLLNDYKEITVEFINANESFFNNFALILNINNELSENDIINPEENHLYYLNKYNKTINNADLLKYNIIGITIIGLIIKEFLNHNYNIKFFTHINSIKNIYDNINNYDTLINDINLYTQDKLPIVDYRAKQLMQKIINKVEKTSTITIGDNNNIQIGSNISYNKGDK